MSNYGTTPPPPGDGNDRPYGDDPTAPGYGQQPAGSTPPPPPPAPEQGQPGYAAQPSYGQAPGYGGQQAFGGPGPHPRGTLILVLGILSVVCASILGPFAWIMGNKAIKEIDANPGAYTNRSQVNIGRILGIIGTILLVLGAIYWIYSLATGHNPLNTSTTTTTSTM